MIDYHECPVCGRLDSNKNKLIQDHRSGNDGHFPCPGSGQPPKGSLPDPIPVNMTTRTDTDFEQKSNAVPVNLAPLIAWLEHSRSNKFHMKIAKDQHSLEITLSKNSTHVSRQVSPITVTSSGSTFSYIEYAISTILSDLA